MANTAIATGTYPGTTYVHYYDLVLTADSNIFLEVSNDTGASSVYTSGMQFVSETSHGSPIHLSAGSYIIKATYSSPTHAVMNVYIPSDNSYASLAALASGSYQASSYDNFYALHIKTGGELFIEASGNSGTAKIYDTQLNYIKTGGSAPIHLDAGDYIVHAGYSSPKNAALNTYIPNELTIPSPESQTIIGTSANESFTGGTADDFIDGSNGIDSSAYSLARSNYAVTKTGTGFTVQAGSGTDGTDTLINIERLQFADKKIALDLTPEGHAGQAMEFIGAVAPGLLNNTAIRGLIISLFDQGQTMESLSQLALDQHLLPTNSNAALANAVYQNVLNGPASPEMTDALVGYIEDHGQANFLATVAGLHINVDLVGLQQTGVEYLI